MGYLVANRCALVVQSSSLVVLWCFERVECKCSLEPLGSSWVECTSWRVVLETDKTSLARLCTELDIRLASVALLDDNMSSMERDILLGLANMPLQAAVRIQ